MDAFDLEGGAPQSGAGLRGRLAALWDSLTGRGGQRFERLRTSDVEKAAPAAEAHPPPPAERPAGLRWCPEEEAGVLSSLTYHFVSGLIRIGFRKPLLQEDLWDVCHRDKATAVCGRFEGVLDATAEGRPAPAVLRAMWRAHSRTVFLIGATKLLDVALVFASPLLLQQLLLSLQEGRPTGHTLAIAGAMFLCSTANTAVNNRYMHRSMRLVMHLKSQLIGMVYGKALRLHSAARGAYPTGTVINLTSNDAQKLWWGPLFMHVLWSAPLQIVAVCLLLVRLLGAWPALAALSATLLLVPSSSLVGRRLSKARKAVVGHTDARVKLTTETILGIKAVKLYSWEAAFTQKIEVIRDLELAAIRRASILNALNTMLFLGGPMFISLAAFGTFGLLGYALTPAVAFPCLSLFNVLRFPLLMLPEQILNVVQGRVALARLQAFMQAEEVRQPPPLPPAAAGETALAIERGCFAWAAADSEAGDVLRDVTLRVAAGQLVMVVGEVGSGKSSLLHALLGEMLARPGSRTTVAGSVAYAAQEPWIRNASLRDNVLMGLPFEAGRYAECMDACALGLDLAQLAAGDLSEIGEKGINLSGGQRARVALARAVYADADCYLLDDPLSAVDAHVASHLFERCICGVLRGKTRLLVSHQLQFAPQADAVALLRGGRLVACGTHAQLLAAGVEFRQFEMEGAEQAAAADAAAESPSKGAAEAPEAAAGEKPAADGIVTAQPAKEPLPPLSRAFAGAPAQRKAAADIIRAEERATGHVAYSQYNAYLRAWSRLAFALPLLFAALAAGERGCQVAQSWWLSVWTDATVRVTPATRAVTDVGAVTAPRLDARPYVGVYFALGGAAVLLQGARLLVLVGGSLAAARKLHSDLLRKVVRLPLGFFASQPSGRLLNRFARDTEAVDSKVPQALGSFLTCLVNVVGSLGISVGVSPLVLLPLAPMAAVYDAVRRRYTAASREIKRLDSLAMSPLFSLLGETLQGLTSVRAARLQAGLRARHWALLDESSRCWWPLVCTNRWLSVRLELLGAALVSCTAVASAVLLPRSAGLAGLAITAALNLTGILNWTVRQATELEVQMNSVERMRAYTVDFEAEAPAIVPTARPPPDWPSAGAIAVRRLSVRYRPDLPPALRGLSLSIAGGEKVGVCGRTGGGKSTFAMALFRVLEPCEGSIRIDGLDIHRMGLADLRSRLSVVPQDPVVFSGSVRSNLDPFGSAGGDGELWGALQAAGLQPAIAALPGGLEAELSEGGSNLSTGQRQLLCMARTLLRKSRILVLDEATSSVDSETDALIQATVRSAFAACTVLTVAHRLHTIRDCDRILVLEAGAVREFAPPGELLQDPGSAFSGLVGEVARQQQQQQQQQPTAGPS